MPQSDPATGLRYAISGDKPSIPQHTKNLVDDLRGKVIPNFATTAARDLAITASLFTPPGIPENFPCTVNGLGLMLYRSGWKLVQAGAEYRQGSDTTPVGMGDGTWMFLTTGTAGPNSGTSITIDPNGIVVPAGLYSVDAYVEWSGSSTGTRRIVGLSLDSPNVPPADSSYLDARGVTSGVQYHPLTRTAVLATSATRIGLWAKQDGGSGVQVGKRQIFVRKVA